jgi:hypothetical protein
MNGDLIGMIKILPDEEDLSINTQEMRGPEIIPDPERREIFGLYSNLRSPIPGMLGDKTRHNLLVQR